MPRRLGTRPFQAGDLAACQRLLPVLPRCEGLDALGLAHPRQETALVLWSRWIVVSPSPIWRGEEGWTGLVWRPLRALIPPGGRLDAVVGGWRHFYGAHLRLQQWQHRFPLHAGIPESVGHRRNRHLRTLQGLMAANPGIQAIDLLRGWTSEGRPRTRFDTEPHLDWELAICACVPGWWERLPGALEPVFDPENERHARLVRGLVTSGSERAMLRILIFSLYPAEHWKTVLGTIRSYLVETAAATANPPVPRDTLRELLRDEPWALSHAAVEEG